VVALWEWLTSLGNEFEIPWRSSTMIQPIRNLLVFAAALVSIIGFAGAQENQIKKTQVKHPVSGAQMFKEYCAVCHGPGGKGDGTVATALKVPPPDLTTLAQASRRELSG
jgi:mono/diheme cytochrome c family protein